MERSWDFGLTKADMTYLNSRGRLEEEKRKKRNINIFFDCFSYSLFFPFRVDKIQSGERFLSEGTTVRKSRRIQRGGEFFSHYLFLFSFLLPSLEPRPHDSCFWRL